MFYLMLIVALVGVDQALKAWVVANLAIGQTRPFIPGVLSLTHLENTGAAFSLLEGKQWLFYLISVVSLIVVWFLWRDAGPHRVYRAGLALIVAGTLGNLIDRVRVQSVTDMFQLEFVNFAIFNVADACLTVGVVLVFGYLLLGEWWANHHG